MSGITSVAIAGAGGALGPHVVKALVDANFQVTVLTRSKTKEYDAAVKVVEVDYTSVESLTAALKGIDGLVSTIATEAIESQTVLIDAAIAAGVKRVIPSEFGSVTTSPKVKDLPIYAPMFKIRQYLQEKAEAGALTWTVLATGAFLDFIFNTPALLDFPNHKATILDEGNNRISSTSLATVGRVIVGIFQNLEATQNKIVRTSEVILTQNGLLKLAGEIRPDIKWEFDQIQTSVLLKEGLDALGAGDFSMPVIFKIVRGSALAGEVYGSAYDETDNVLLGVRELTEEDLKKLIAEKLA